LQFPTGISLVHMLVVLLYVLPLALLIHLLSR
jgi:hypothetical protein